MRTAVAARRTPVLIPFSRCARWAFAALAISIGVTVAHGCHKADADHEPAVAPPTSEHRTP